MNRPSWRAVVLLVAVALAFADASVVALALPDMYADFDTTIVGVSWVLTTYALAVAIVAVPVALLHRRVVGRTLVLTGAAVFAAASLVAGFAPTLQVLLAARAGQGAGAALLLAGCLPVLDALVASEGRGRRWWAVAGAIGTAVGPALGGALTELFDWRAIFFVQAPVVALAVVAAAPRSVRSSRVDSRGFLGQGRDTSVWGAMPAEPPVRHADDGGGLEPAPEVRPAGWRIAVANAGFALVFAALVAALFLGVLLAIEVWRYSPLGGAALVSALPLGMALGRLGHAAPSPWRAGGGCLLLALGLTGLAMLPGERWGFAAAAFAMCGAGFDLVHEVLDEVAVPAHGSLVRNSAVSVSARHAGLVLGLAIIAPLLSTSIADGIQRATLGATRTMLEADLDLQDKIPVTWHLRDAIESAPRGQVPDLGAVFAKEGAKGDNDLARARDQLQGVVADAMTRSFRPAFIAAALIALAALVPAMIVALTRRKERARRGAAIGIVIAVVAGFGLIAGSFVAGAANVGELVEADPCTAGPDPHPGSGLDAAVQRIALSTLNGAACELGTTRERLVLSLDGNSGYRDVQWDDATLEKAMRSGADRAIDDADDRGTIPGWAASILHFAVEHAPVSWLTERIDLPG